jgi:lysozyme family protein
MGRLGRLFYWSQRMTDISALKRANAARWTQARLTRGPEFKPVAARLVSRKARYQAISAKTGVPWFVIAVIHEREAGADPGFGSNIANGQPWSKVTTIVPEGRGPFQSFEDAAYDALVNCAPYAGKWKDWSAGGTLTLLEQYNGLGYANRGLPSPYIWSGTDQYAKGKYVRDGVFDANAIDKQLGCAGLLLAMQTLDASVSFTGAVPVVISAKPAAVPVTPEDHAKVGGAVVVATGTAGAAAAAQSGASPVEILFWIGGLTAVAIAAFIIGYRIIKGVWPWTGNQSQEASLLSPPQSAPSLADLSQAQLALASAASQARHLPKSSASIQPLKRSAKPSQKTRTQPRKSSSLKPTAVQKSPRKQASKSRS